MSEEPTYGQYRRAVCSLIAGATVFRALGNEREAKENQRIAAEIMATFPESWQNQLTRELVGMTDEQIKELARDALKRP